MRLVSFALTCCLIAAISPAPTYAGTRGGSSAISSSELCPGFHAKGLSVRRVDFMGFLPSEDAAVEAAAEIDEARFEVTARPAAIGFEWVVIAAYRQLPSLPILEQDRRTMKALGRRFGADGFTHSCISNRYRR